MKWPRWIRLVLVARLGALLIAAPLAQPAAAQDEEPIDPQPKTLTEIGIDFEWARLRPIAERGGAFGDVAMSLDQILRGDLRNHEKSAAYFLAGEIRFGLGDYSGAQQDFENATKEGKKSPFADDAAFASIIALEAQGQDEEAAKAWKKWQKKYAGSQLLPEALLAQAWNAMRRDTLREAAQYLEDLRTQFPYMETNPRVKLVEATAFYLMGDPDGALIHLAEAPDRAVTVYLTALCRQAKGEALKAAASFQEVVERFPHSSVRDHAMLAKANIFLESGAFKSAAEEFARAVEQANDPDVRAECELRRAVCMFRNEEVEEATDALRQVTAAHFGTSVGARAQLLLGEFLISQSRYEDAILEFNRVLTDYFEHELAASAQYRVGRCLDALGRHSEATSAYQLVVSGYPLSPQSPAAAYLAGVGLLEQDRPQPAIPYFQLVLDRYAHNENEGFIVFSSPNHQELVEASLCLLEWSYHQVGNMGQLSGVPHMMLLKMPSSRSPWRAYALLIDADALASQARYEEANTMLQTLIEEFPDHDVAVPANRLLAWTYAQQGQDDLAIKTEERMLARYASDQEADHLSSAYLNKAHILFNAKKFDEAATTYDDFLNRFPDHPNRLLALYQSGLCHNRLGNTGNAVDRWEELVTIDPTTEIAEKAWARAGDLYFQTDHYEDAKRCYRGLIDNFPESRATALGMLRLAQCDYNAGRDAEALKLFSSVIARFPETGIAREAERGMERALYRLGQSEGGAEVLAQLVEEHPNSPFAADAQFEVAMRSYDAGEFATAAEEFRRVVSQFPGYSAADQAHFLMGDSHSQAGNVDDARMAYEQFLMFFPDSDLRTTVRFRLASIRFDEGDYMRAAVDFTNVTEEETTTEIASAALYNLALCRVMLGESAEARVSLERYRDTYPNDQREPEVAYQLGDLHEKAGECEAAIEEFDRALTSKPDKDRRIELHYRIGTCREQLGNDTDALAAYEKAMASKDKTNAFRLSAVARSAAIYEKNGDFKLALGAYRDLIENAKDPEIVLAAKERASQLEAVKE